MSRKRRTFSGAFKAKAALAAVLAHFSGPYRAPSGCLYGGQIRKQRLST
jgi:hypothetical protein